jgi:predicted AAA+ superfamily ATPase
MRKTSDLVAEMRAEAKNAWLVAIAVGFKTETKFVFSSRRYPLEELDRLVKNGGFPVGLLRFDKENRTVQGSYRPFLEYENEDWAKQYLAGLLDNTGEIIELSLEPSPGFPKAY